MLNSHYPDYLKSFDNLQQHIRAQLEGLNTTEKGLRFAEFVQRLIPQTELGSIFDFPNMNNKISGDGGVDLSAQGKSGNTILYIQSKLHVDRADTIDSVISKFQSFTRSTKQGQQTLFDIDIRINHFVLVTLSPLSGILEKYEKAEFASIDFYKECVKDNRLKFIDGHQILALLQTAYNKINHLPQTIELNFEAPYTKMGDVYVGVMSGTELKNLYTRFGDALFFENVRDFLGVPRMMDRSGRTTPNSEIVKTIVNEPEKMLARNNGIVFGAEKITPSKSQSQLILENGSVVNGCQTTMCIVEYSDGASRILVKAVQTDDSWDITKSANYQTSVADIDLELARYLRPQLVKRAASNIGVQILDKEKSAFQIIDQMYDRKVAYDETRLLYIGLFSRSPNNVFASNYTELIYDLINSLYQTPSCENDIFEMLFSMQGLAQVGLKQAQEIFKNPAYSGKFDRLYKQESLPYRCFISILALCGAAGVNIAERNDDLSAENSRVRKFLSTAQSIFTNEPEQFIKYYKLAVKIWMLDMITDDDDAKVRRDMYIESKRSNFNVMYQKLCIEADLDSSAKPE